MEFEQIRLQLDRVLEKREGYLPDRRKDAGMNAELDSAVDNFVSYILEKVQNGYRTEIDKDKATKALELAEHPIFICGPIKSGTTLLSNLLDSHPSLVVLPEDSYYAIHANDGYLQDKDLNELAAYHIRKYLINRRTQWFFPKQEEHYLNFVNWLKFYIETTEFDPLVCVALSIFSCNPNCNGNESYWVEKTASNEYFVKDFHNAKFPKAKYIHILREPLNNLASIKKLYSTRNREFLPIGMSYYLNDCHKLARLNRDTIGADRYHIIRYEKLIANPEDTMKRLADFLAIPYNETLMTPTLNSIPATANTMFRDHTVTGKISRFTDNDKWLGTLNAYEKFCSINFLANQPDFNVFDWERNGVKKWRLPALGNEVVRFIGKTQSFFKPRPGPDCMLTVKD